MSQKFEFFSVTFTILVTSILTVSSAPAGDLIRHGRVRHCLPSYRYGASKPVVVARVDSAPAVRLDKPVGAAASHFVIPESTARYVTMTQPAAIVYASGDVHFSCLLVHNGGNFGQLSGSRCRLRIQFLRRPGEFAEAEIVAPILHEIVREMYVARSRPLSVHLKAQNSPAFERDFAELSQVRVHLECILDR